MRRSNVSLRFLHWPNPVNERDKVFAKLLELALNTKIEIVTEENIKVDIEIESVYARQKLPNHTTRLYRFLASHMPSGIDFSKEKYSPNQQPNGNCKYSIFYTGENERPPFGDWDAYLTFDLNSYGKKNAYLPLWWLTSTDLVQPTISPYLGKSITIDQLLKNRNPDWASRDKFCAAFIGKAYPFRMQAIAALSKIGKVDVYGEIARNEKNHAALEKFNTSQLFHFIFAFENDLFPGYVTEKAPEAWATGAVPLYWGSDPQGYINQNALINLANFENLDTFVSAVSKVNSSKELWEAIAREKFLAKEPNLNEVLKLLRNTMPDLVMQ